MDETRRRRSQSPGHGSPKRERHSGSRRRRDDSERGRGDAPQITQDDYYRLNAPFRLWLRKEKDRYFDEMGSDKARRYFASFVRAWNDGRLSSRYYSHGGDLGSLSKGVVTRHDWGLAADNAHQATTAADGPRRGTLDAADGSLAEDTRHRRKKERREAREREELILDEVAPKETGREAKIVKRRNLNQVRHGERSLDVEIPDEDLYKDAGDDLAAFKQDRDTREQRQQARRQAARDAQGHDVRLKERADKERATVEALREMARLSRAQGLGMTPRPAAPQ
ncbi:hypothetical protein H4R19_001799 [Coemansia spiralis]|nr:hypothetical protein H4R19_001799 [Coemansia spiralis]